MDQSRWEALLAHRERLLTLALSRGVSVEDAKDVVQEALLRCAEFEPLDLDRMPQFLTSVTIRLCADVHRRGDEPRRAKRWLTPLMYDEPDPAEVVCRDFGPEWVEALVGRLPERQRHVIVDRASGLTIQQIASRHRLTYKAVESALARARAALRSAVATSWSVAAVLNRRLRGVDVPITASAATATFAVTAALVGSVPLLAQHSSRVPGELALPMGGVAPGQPRWTPYPHPTPDHPTPAPRPGRPHPTPTSGYQDPLPTFQATIGPVRGGRSPEPSPFPYGILDCLKNGVDTWPTVQCHTPSATPQATP